jgi:hypothetical protein
MRFSNQSRTSSQFTGSWRPRRHEAREKSVQSRADVSCQFETEAQIAMQPKLPEQSQLEHHLHVPGQLSGFDSVLLQGSCCYSPDLRQIDVYWPCSRSAKAGHFARPGPRASLGASLKARCCMQIIDRLLPRCGDSAAGRFSGPVCLCDVANRLLFEDMRLRT